MINKITNILKDKIITIKDKITINREEDVEITSNEPFEVIIDGKNKCCFFKYIFRDKGGVAKKKTLEELRKENKIGFLLNGEFNGKENVKYFVINNKTLKEKLSYKKTEVAQIFGIECCIVIIKGKISNNFYIKNSIGDSIKIPINIDGIVTIIFKKDRTIVKSDKIYTLIPIKKTKLFLHFDIDDKIDKMYYVKDEEAIEFFKKNI